MKRLVYIISVLIAFSQALPALAVTDKEMEQARVIATQTYLRYANDGSGYLDALHPTTMAELEKNLKPKEKENIKAFKAIPVPTGYASWDKQKLVDYWSTTAFSQAGLTDKGKIGKNPARKKLSNMKVAAPAAQPATQPAAQPAAAAQAAAAAAEQKPASAPQPSTLNPQPSTTDSLTSTLNSQPSTLNPQPSTPEAAFDDEDPMIQKESSYTWIYVVVLCILVAVVVALVVFASNVMKKSAPAPGAQQGNNAAGNPEETKALMRKLKETTVQLNDAEKQNQQLMKKVEALTAEIVKLKSRQQPSSSQQPPIQGIPYPKTMPIQDRQPQKAAPASSQPQAVVHQQASTPQPQAAAPTPRTIYLGRANAKGIFVRADRTFNPGYSVYSLDTTDGLVGTFRVVSDPSIIEKVIEHPAEMLSAACIGPDLANTEDLQTIVTDSAGTATFFEDKCWKVLRKAKIHYE